MSLSARADAFPGGRNVFVPGIRALGVAAPVVLWGCEEKPTWWYNGTGGAGDADGGGCLSRPSQTGIITRTLSVTPPRPLLAAADLRPPRREPRFTPRALIITSRYTVAWHALRKLAFQRAR